jgi:DNA-binding CsgD family transcriptional regulator
MEARREGGIDDILASNAVLGRPGWTQGFIIYRPWGDVGFGPRERSQLRLFRLELLRLLRRDGPRAEERATALGPRLRQVLGLLLEGRSAKEVARHLGLSLHTVNSYIKESYERLHVSSRPQLLAECLRRPPRTPILLPSEFVERPGPESRR